MQSFNDLNNFANTSVNYNSQSDYTIVYGVPLGNATVTAVEGSIFTVPKQQPVTSMTDITRDLLIIITPDPMTAVAFVQYAGADTGISVVSDEVSRWIVSGVRTVSQYNDVFTNLRMGVAPGFSSVGTYTFEVALDDQMNDVFVTYTVTVTVTASTVFTVPALVTYNEDQNARVGNIVIVENFLYPTNYTATLTTENPANSQLALAPGNVAANTLTFTNRTKANLNATLANIVFVPRPDFAGNTYIDTTITRLYDNEPTGKRTLANVAVDIPDYSAPPGYGWSESGVTTIGTTPIANLAITDQAVGKNYSSTITITPANMGNLQVGNTILGNTVTYTGNKTTVNNSLANVTFAGNPANKLSGNVGYVQIQTTDSITQANITMPITYQIPAIHIFSNVAKPFGTRLGANATPNVDFWAANFGGTTTVTGGQTYFNYTGPSSGNIDLSTVRRNDVYQYGPLSIGIIPYAGITSRAETRAAGTAGYFGFWMRALQSHPQAVFVQLNRDDNIGNESGLCLSSYEGNLYWNLGDSVRPSASGFNPMIELGPTPVGDYWTHFAIQISAGTPANLPSDPGTQVVSVWRDGQPITAFYSGYAADPPNQRGVLQTGLTWEGKGNFANINRFSIGAPLQSRSWMLNINGVSGPPQGINSSIGFPFVEIQVDDIQIRNDNPYTDLQPFTPQPVTWGGNVTQMVTGI